MDNFLSKIIFINKSTVIHPATIGEITNKATIGEITNQATIGEITNKSTVIHPAIS